MSTPETAQVWHAIRWEFDDGIVRATAVCYAAPDADCRLAPADHHDCQCEFWGQIVRKPDGTIWHHAHSDYYSEYDQHDEPVLHRLIPGDDCNVCLFINESGCVEELAVAGTRINLGETPIEPVWIDDGCDWAVVNRPGERRSR